MGTNQEYTVKYIQLIKEMELVEQGIQRLKEAFAIKKAEIKTQLKSLGSKSQDSFEKEHDKLNKEYVSIVEKMHIEQHKLRYLKHQLIELKDRYSDKKPEKSKENIKATNQEEYVMFTCFIVADGVGDLVHFIDIIKRIEKENLLKGRKPLYVIGCRSYSERYGDLLSEAGFDIKDDNIRFVGSKDEESFVEKNEEILKKVKSMFSISFANPMNPYSTMENDSHGIARSLRNFFNKNKMPVVCSSIFEHGQYDRVQGGFESFYGVKHKTSKNPALDKRYFTGFDVKERGVFLKEQPKSDKTDVLLSMKHKSKDFFECLVKRDLKSFDKKDAKDFMKKTLIVPCYFQGLNDDAYLDCFNMIAASEISEKYDEVVFVVNNSAINTNIDFYRNKLSDKIQEMTFVKQIDGKIHKENIMNLKNNQKGKNVRIISGFRLNSEDYDRLFELAQVFGGCSGDKTFEKVLENGLIPYHTKKAELWLRFSEYTRAILSYELKDRNSKDQISEYLRKTYEIMQMRYSDKAHQFDFAKHKELQQEIIKLLTPELIEQWKIVMNNIRKHFNFYDLLSKIVRENFELADLAFKKQNASEGKAEHEHTKESESKLEPRKELVFSKQPEKRPMDSTGPQKEESTFTKTMARFKKPLGSDAEEE